MCGNSSANTPIASCTQPPLGARYFSQAVAYMPRPEVARLFETSPRLDMGSLMLFPSSMGRALDALSYPLLTARDDIIYLDGNPDASRSGLSRGEIDRVMALYPRRRGAPQQGPAGRPGKPAAKRWSTVPEDHETQPGDIRPW